MSSNSQRSDLHRSTPAPILSSSDDSVPPLSVRRRQILALLVQDYIATAQPVGSASLVRRHDLGWSSATVRAELAQLEELGFLSHPHVSAGRVPTVAGYRYFVEHLMRRYELPYHERQTIRHQFHQAGWDLERWMKLSAAVMARVSGLAALVAARRRAPSELRRIEFVDLGDGAVQVIGIMDEGQIRQLRWRPGRSFDQGALDGVAGRMNIALESQDLNALLLRTTAEGPDSGLERSALDTLQQFTQERAESRSAQLYHAGLSHVLREPEFSENSRLLELVELLEHGQGLDPIINRLPEKGVQVIIGGEPPLDQWPYMTLVLSRFGVDSAGGVLGVIGPTRMAYDRAVPAVDFMARLMSNLVAGDVA